MVGRSWLRAIGAAVLGFVAVLSASATPSAAASYTFTFTGTVTIAEFFFASAGVTPGDKVSGSLTFDPFNTTALPDVFNNTKAVQSASSFTFHVSHPGVFDFTHSGVGDGQMLHFDNGTAATLDFQAVGPVDGLRIGVQTFGTPGVLLSSFAGMPGDATAIMAFLGGKPFASQGIYSFFGAGNLVFDIDFTPVAIAATPIPAALPLFGAGLAVLGFAARRRRMPGARA